MGASPGGEERKLAMRLGADAAILPRQGLTGNLAWQAG